MNPIKLFQDLYSNECENNNLNYPGACCLSTIGLDGYPNSRFVSLKAISEEAFVITGSLNSRKGKEIEKCAKGSLTFWWTYSEVQVRIQGDVSTLEAKDYFKVRNRDSKIVSTIFEQGIEIGSIRQMQEHFNEQKMGLENAEIKAPESFGAIHIKPIRIEIMHFKKSRLHERKLYQRIDNKWEASILQP